VTSWPGITTDSGHADAVVALLRINYDRITERRKR
jgi:hypothetical protein